MRLAKGFITHTIGEEQMMVAADVKGILIQLRSIHALDS